eukprot:CAMPEP_0171082158 /NCGR_PEP_ID=MMETSP0766_2-20121228/16927_1 /TAXON_ID=439317 /ORGANISM="Gambierdiscus australes, Strain CAWD 149" /LENGTH=421 /DNA_ID=CAMNT_0011539499 /DNA_START=7 /DNA_END=1269 /DNA_ORIENTATION=+
MASASRRGQDDAPPRRTHIEDGLEIPDHLEGVTFDQKKRLARLAKMGLGPVAKPTPSAEKTRRVAASAASAPAGPSEDAAHVHQQQQLERRAALMERERRLRLELQRQEEEDQRQQEEDERKRQEREKAAKARAGLKSLGPVQPREEAQMPKPTVGYPAPAPAPAASCAAPIAGREANVAPLVDTPKVAPAKLEVKLYASTVERVASATSEVPEDPSSSKRRFREATDGDSSEAEAEAAASSSAALAAEIQRRALIAKAEKRAAFPEEKKRKKAKKKRNKKRESSPSEEEKSVTDEGGAAPDEDARARGLSDIARKQARDGGISWNMMHVESVKGKVSNANKGFTDADLERRFGPRETVPTGGLMTEQQVLAIMRRDKKGKSESDWAMRRAQRELAEWTQVKAQRMARTGEEKERLVVSGR